MKYLGMINIPKVTAFVISFGDDYSGFTAGDTLTLSYDGSDQVVDLSLTDSDANFEGAINTALAALGVGADAVVSNAEGVVSISSKVEIEFRFSTGALAKFSSVMLDAVQQDTSPVTGQPTLNVRSNHTTDEAFTLPREFRSFLLLPSGSPTAQVSTGDGLDYATVPDAGYPVPDPADSRVCVGVPDVAHPAISIANGDTANDLRVRVYGLYRPLTG